MTDLQTNPHVMPDDQPPLTTQNKAQDLLNKLKEKERIEAQLSGLNVEIATGCKDLNETMTEEGINSIEIEGIKFAPDIDRNFKIIGAHPKASWDTFPKWFAFLREIGEDGLIQTKETVQWQTRVKWLKEWVDGKNMLPDFIEETFFNTVKWNKSAIKRMVSQ